MTACTRTELRGKLKRLQSGWK